MGMKKEICEGGKKMRKKDMREKKSKKKEKRKIKKEKNGKRYGRGVLGQMQRR